MPVLRYCRKLDDGKGRGIAPRPFFAPATNIKLFVLVIDFFSKIDYLNIRGCGRGRSGRSLQGPCDHVQELPALIYLPLFYTPK